MNKVEVFCFQMLIVIMILMIFNIGTIWLVNIIMFLMAVVLADLIFNKEKRENESEEDNAEEYDG